MTPLKNLKINTLYAELKYRIKEDEGGGGGRRRNPNFCTGRQWHGEMEMINYVY